MLLYDTTMAKRYKKAPSYVKEQLDREARRGKTVNRLIGVDMKAVKRYERLTGKTLSDATMGTARRATRRASGSIGMNAGYRKRYH